MEQLCCRVADLYFILHRMGVVLMNKRFDFKDLMTFGLFIREYPKVCVNLQTDVR